ncbi:MAG: LLM class F420-dependent oxidoreductase [Alphaproteobacteria bacterium]
MRYGYVVSVRGPLANRDSVRALAEAGETLGFDYVSMTDHVVVPRTIASAYPYTADGAFPAGESGECLELLSMLAFVAGATKTIRLITSVMVLPHRPAVLTAKMLATIDVLSGGRVTVGCGVGWMKEEFQALGALPFAARGKVADEYLASFRTLWTDAEPRFEGEHVRFADIAFEPKPLQKPHPPLWIGGESDPAMRRAVRLADGWYPMGLNPRRPLDTLERLRSGVTRLHRFAEAAGRDPATLALAYIAPWYDPNRPSIADDGSRRLFTGDPAAIAGDIAALGEIGFGTLVLSFARRTLDRSIAGMERFAAEIRPLAN